MLQNLLKKYSGMPELCVKIMQVQLFSEYILDNYVVVEVEVEVEVVVVVVVGPSWTVVGVETEVEVGVQTGVEVGLRLKWNVSYFNVDCVETRNYDLSFVVESY